MKRIMRFIALALALLLCGGAVAEESWYVEEGQALVDSMQALAADEAYAGLMGGGNGEMSELKEAFVQADFSKPDHAWFLPLPEGEALFSAIAGLFTLEDGAEGLETLNALSEAGKEKLIRQLPASAASLLTGRAGVGWILLSNLVSAGEAKEEPEGFVPGFLLLEYPGDFAALITFTRPLTGFVSASASPVPAGSLETVQPVLDYAKLLGLALELEEWTVE